MTNRNGDLEVAAIEKKEEVAPEWLTGFDPVAYEYTFPGWQVAPGNKRKPAPRRKRRRYSRANAQQYLPGFRLYIQSAMPIGGIKERNRRPGYNYPRRRRPETAGGVQPGLPGWETYAKAVKFRNMEQEKEEFLKRKMRYIRQHIRRVILRRDNYLCVYCQADLRNVPPEIDHRVPVTMRGNNRIDNLQSTCRTCNRRKRHYSDGAELREYLHRRQYQDAGARQSDFFSEMGDT